MSQATPGILVEPSVPATGLAAGIERLAEAYLLLGKRPVGRLPGYGHLKAELLLLAEDIQSRSLDALPTLNRALLKQNLAAFSLDQAPLTLPRSVAALYPAQLQRLEENLATQGDGYFDLQCDAFVKDLAFLQFRLIPVGAEFVAPEGGVPRSLLLRQGFARGLNMLSLIRAAGGWKPYLTLHMHQHVTADFNPQGWLSTYDRLADLLELNAQFRGVQSTSWFLDPALETISPHLSYLRTVPLACGAGIYFAGEDREGVSGALSRSQTRRELFRRGDYMPRLHTRVWPRSAMLARQWEKLATESEAVE